LPFHIKNLHFMRIFSLFLFCSLIGFGLKAQDGTLDNTFSLDGILTFNPSGTTHDNGNSIGLQSDGKIITGGVIGVVGAFEFNVLICRFNTNGSVDSTFGTNGYFTMPGGNFSDFVYDIEVLADDKIVACGGTTPVQNNAMFHSFRLTADGELDTSFGTNGITNVDINTANDYAYGMLINDAGQIYLLGSSAVPGFTYDRLAVARLTPNGILDTSFGTNGITNNPQPSSNVSTVANDFAWSPDMQYIYFAGYRGQSSYDYQMLGRLKTNDGTVDGSFGTNGYVFSTSFYGTYADVLVHSNENIYCFGYRSTTSDNPAFAGAYDSNGDLITNFGTNGYLEVAPAALCSFQSSMELPSGDMLVCGNAGPATGPPNPKDFFVALITDEGTLNPLWSDDGMVVTSVSQGSETAYGMSQQNDGKIVVVGTTSSTNNDVALVRYNLNSSVVFALTASDLSTNVACFGDTDGTATIYPSGGTPPYTISFNGELPSSIFEFTDLVAGTYYYTIYDAASAQANGNLTITSPDELQVTADIAGLVVTLVPSGGLPPYQYDIDGSMVQTNPVYNNLSEGSYVFTITDSNNCTATTEAQLVPTAEIVANANRFKAYPTLTQGEVKLVSELDLTDQPIFAIGIDGRSVQLGIWPAIQTQSLVNLNALPDGTYQIRCGNQVATVVLAK
jgi:uncharacterized delta-60 repeat protein